jgi:hypothetical protein
MIRGAADLLEDLGVDMDRTGQGPAPEGLSGVEREVFEVLTGPMLPALVAQAAGISQGDALSALIGLELRGLVRGNGGRFERTFRREDGRASV